MNNKKYLYEDYRKLTESTDRVKLDLDAPVAFGPDNYDFAWTDMDVFKDAVLETLTDGQNRYEREEILDYFGTMSAKQLANDYHLYDRFVYFNTLRDFLTEMLNSVLTLKMYSDGDSIVIPLNVPVKDEDEKYELMDMLPNGDFKVEVEVGDKEMRIVVDEEFFNQKSIVDSMNA